MSILKPKVPRLTSIAGKTDTGGAPFWSEDMVTIQENNRADLLNSFEDLRRKLPELLYYQGFGLPLVKEFENGIILSGCEYDNTDVQNPVVSQGYILSGGEVCYYPGGTYNTGPTAPGLIYLFKGAAAPVNRTFDDGNSKEMLVSYNCSVEVSFQGAQGVIMPGGTAIVPSDEVVVISCGVGSGLAESYFSRQAALGIGAIGAKLTRNAWADAVLGTGVAFDPPIMPYLVSRVRPDGYVEIIGAIKIDYAALVYPDPIIATLNGQAQNINMGSSLALWAKPQDQGRVYESRVSINAAGEIRIEDGVPNFPASGLDTIIFNCLFWGRNEPPADQYEYKEDFLNIT